MTPEYLKICEGGLSGELHFLSLYEVVNHLKNHISNFILDPIVAISYLERFISDKENMDCHQPINAIDYLCDKILQNWPFMISAFSTPRTRKNPNVQRKLLIIQKTNTSPETIDLIDDLDIRYHADDKYKFLLELLTLAPYHATAAQHLLNIDLYFGRSPQEWIKIFKCPQHLKDDFSSMLFNHYSHIGDTENALQLWDMINNNDLNETTYNYAGDLFSKINDNKKAIECYNRSLLKDCFQIPIYFKLSEVKHPTPIDSNVLSKFKTNIYLYTFNKAKNLNHTLTDLAHSDIGDSRIKILLNGCTDNSHDIAQNAYRLFPNNPIEIIELPVNVGAPAARNWLIAHPDTQKADYIAFLDDDVSIPDDWLKWLLTIAASDSKIGVVGCKILHNGNPKEYQYLYRYISIAKDDFLRVSIDVPNKQFDTGRYDIIRETRSVMGCCHLLNTKALLAAPQFDIRFSPSQIDDIDHDLELCLKGYKTYYCGKVGCIHYQNSGISSKTIFNPTKVGNCIGNDIKFYYKHANRMQELAKLNSVDLLPNNLQTIIKKFPISPL